MRPGAKTRSHPSLVMEGTRECDHLGFLRGRNLVFFEVAPARTHHLLWKGYVVISGVTSIFTRSHPKPTPLSRRYWHFRQRNRRVFCKG